MDKFEMLRFYTGAVFALSTPHRKCFAQVNWVSVTDFSFLCGEDIHGEWFEIDVTERSTEVAPILRHVSAMDVYSKRHYRSLCHEVKIQDEVVRIADTPQSILFLLKGYYDGFDLIENNAAFDYLDIIAGKYKITDKNFVRLKEVIPGIYHQPYISKPKESKLMKAVAQ